MTEFTEADEIALARKHPTAHPLRRVPLSEAYAATRFVSQTSLLLGRDAARQSHQVFRRNARELVNMQSYPWVQFWFESPDGRAADYAAGQVQSWGADGEIEFLGGTRLNDKLLLRVTF